MNLTFIFMTSIALAMDAFTVSLSQGMNMGKIDMKLAFKISLSFAIFQGLMPLVGWVASINFSDYIKSIDHIIALILLCFLGCQMIFSKNDNSKCHNLNNLDILILSIATSIDALAVGVSFAFLNISIVPIVVSISIITFLLCFLGISLGSKIGLLFGSLAKIIGGILLILIGFNIFNEHTGIINFFF